jgi:hypothetical protein
MHHLRMSYSWFDFALYHPEQPVEGSEGQFRSRLDSRRFENLTVPRKIEG